MKTTISFATALIALATTTSAMSMSGCTISHNSGNGGNQFVIYWNSVPSVSQSSICGSFNSDLQAQAAANGMQFKGLSCATSGSDMSTVLTLNKQSCQSQANVIVKSMQVALGSAGSLASSNTCTFTGC